MKETKSRILFLVLALVLTVSAFPALAAEVDEPVLVQHMVREMTRQGVPDETAVRLAHRNRFMAEMVTGTLEQERQRLQDCDCEPVGDQLPDRIGEDAQDCALDGTGEALSRSVQARVGSAFGRALSSAYNNYGEKECSQAAQALFSATRRGLSPETGAATVEAFAENGYRLEEMYQFGMWMAERVSTGTQVDEETLCEQIQAMTRQRVRLAAMKQQMDQVTDGTAEEDSQSCSATGKTAGKGSSGGNASGNGGGNGNSGGNSGGGNGNGSGGGGNGGSGGGNGQGK